jgi:hypothetical protein
MVPSSAFPEELEVSEWLEDRSPELGREVDFAARTVAEADAQQVAVERLHLDDPYSRRLSGHGNGPMLASLCTVLAGPHLDLLHHSSGQLPVSGSRVSMTMVASARRRWHGSAAGRSCGGSVFPTCCQFAEINCGNGHQRASTLAP